MIASTAPRLVHRTAHIRLRLTRRQTTRCYGLLRSAGDVWAWLLDTNRQRHQQGEPAITNYQALCRELAETGGFGELSTVGARSVLRRYADAWFQATKRRKAGQQDAGFPRRKRALMPVRLYHGTFTIQGQRVRLPVARGRPELWVRLARPLPYPPEQVRSVTLLADGGRLWLAVTAAVPIQQDRDLDSGGVAGVDLGIIHPYAVVTKDAGLLVSGRAIRAESYLHRADQQARQTKAAPRAPRPGQRGSRRWRRHRARLRKVEARHRRRVHQAQHEAARRVVAFAVQQRIGSLVVGDAKGITNQDAGRVQNWRLRQWRRTHLLRSLLDKAEQAGIVVRLVDERGTSSTCPVCLRRVAKPNGRQFHCPGCGFRGHRDLVGAANIAAKAGGGPTSTGVPVLVEHRRAGQVPARRDRRRHLHDQRRRFCLASGHPPDDPVSAGRRSLGVPDLAPGEDQATPPSRANVA
ncbi:MAG TPA: transposase [Actinomycetota bacterium]|jgi:IS605 OrfB family transposase|nr:transposase [Actinomycetota bacterium]